MNRSGRLGKQSEQARAPTCAASPEQSVATAAGSFEDRLAAARAPMEVALDRVTRDGASKPMCDVSPDVSHAKV